MHRKKMTSTFGPGLRGWIWTMILLGTFVFCLSTVNAHKCYQETANASTVGDGSCFLNYSGQYGSVNDDAYLYINYSKPYLAYNLTWMVKFENNVSNYTVPVDCFNNPSKKVQFYVYTTVDTSPVENILQLKCYNESQKQWIDTLPPVSIRDGIQPTGLVPGTVTRLFDGDWNTAGSWNFLPGDLWVSTVDALPVPANRTLFYEEAAIWDYYTDTDIVQVNHTDVGESFETSYVDFTLNELFNWTRFPLSTGRLRFNSQWYPATVTRTDFGANYDVKLDLPAVDATTVLPYYWELTFVNGTTQTTVYEKKSFNIFEGTVFPYNITDVYYQLLLATDDCASSLYQPIAYFSAFDEGSLSKIKPFDFKGTFNFWLGSGTTYINYSIDAPSSNNISICDEAPENSSNLSSFFMDADIQYSDVNSTWYNPRNYFFDNQSLLQSASPNFVAPINYDLYLLNKTASTSFIEIVYDKNNLVYPGVLIYSYRYYPGEGIYRIVEVSKTDTSGITVGQFETETPEYKFILKKNTATILETIAQKIVPTAVPYTLTFNIGQDVTGPYELYGNKSLFTYTPPTLDNATHILSFSYVDSGNITNYVRMLVTAMNPVSGGSTICDVNSTLTAATLTCDLSGKNDTVQVSIFLSRSPESPVLTIILTLYTALKDAMGRLGYFMGWLIILTAFMIAIYNPTVGIITGNVAMWIVNFVGLITFGYVWLFAILAISIFLIVELRT